MENQPAKGIKLFIGNLSPSFTEAELREVLQPYGAIHDVYIFTDKATGSQKGCCFVNFVHREAADKAIEGLNGIFTLGNSTSPMMVKFAEGNGPEYAKLFVGNLIASSTDEKIREAFGACGTVRDIITIRRPNGPQNGCSFVYMNHQGEAERAVTQLDGQVIDGISEGATEGRRNSGLTVRLAESEEEKNSRRNKGMQNPMMGGYMQPGYGAPAPYGAPMGGPPRAAPQYGAPEANVFVFNLPSEFTEDQLRAEFSPYGNISSIRLVTDRDTGVSKGYAFVAYDNSASAQSAIQAKHGSMLGDREIKVELKKPRGQGPPGRGGPMRGAGRGGPPRQYQSPYAMPQAPQPYYQQPQSYAPQAYMGMPQAPQQQMYYQQPAQPQQQYQQPYEQQPQTQQQPMQQQTQPMQQMGQQQQPQAAMQLPQEYAQPQQQYGQQQQQW